MIPFIQVHRVSIGPVGFHPFGLLVITGTVLGIWTAAQFGRRRGVSNPFPLLLWVGAAGIVGAHWASAIFYFPGRFVSDAWVLFRLLDGLASVGGFYGGATAFLWLTQKAPNRWLLADMVITGFVLTFTIVRVACSLVHDHPGIVVSQSHLLGVSPWPDGTTRLDVGLLELVVMAGLGLLLTVRAWTRDGERTLMIALIYAIMRFGLDFLRVGDAVRAGLTPAQWGMLGIVVVVVALWRRLPTTLSAATEAG